MTRYAVYFVPAADSPLWVFGCAAVGYDSQKREDAAFHDHPVYRHQTALDWTAEPRRYGFHATLKPPFELASTAAIDDLERTGEAFVEKRVPFEVQQLKVSPIGRFLALVPAEASSELNQLAGDCIRTFEPFRAPLTAADRERRLKPPLTPSQVENLDQWGYPYVFDQFRFHMTLTGQLPEAEQNRVCAALQELYAPIDQPVRFDAITICEQPDRDSRFFVRRRLTFGG